MNLLLDTHTFLWTILSTGQLPPTVLKEIQNGSNQVFVSAISFWEISIKARLGKINLLNVTTVDLIPSATKMGFVVIGLAPDEAVTQGSLSENTHFDPFDRMLVWQAIQRRMTLVSRDKEFKKFKKDGLKLLWK